MFTKLNKCPTAYPKLNCNILNNEIMLAKNKLMPDKIMKCMK